MTMEAMSMATLRNGSSSGGPVQPTAFSRGRDLRFDQAENSCGPRFPNFPQV